MKVDMIQIGAKTVQGYVIPAGPVNLVFACTPDGLVGCGAIDAGALDRFHYAAARVRPTRGTSIATIEDLLAGEIREANEAARQRGVAVGMSGREALERM